MSAADRMVIRAGDGTYRSVPRRVGLGMISRGHAEVARGGRATGGYPEPGYTPDAVEPPAGTPLTADELTGTEGTEGVPCTCPEAADHAPSMLALVDMADVDIAPAGESDTGDADVPAVQAVPLPQEPRGNASRAAWAEYAQSLGVEVTSSMTRDQIRDAAQDAAQSLANLPQPALPGGRLETPEDEPVTEESVTDDEDPGTR